jgi:hypothetical protein
LIGLRGCADADVYDRDERLPPAASEKCFLAQGCVLLSNAIALFFMKKARILGGVGEHLSVIESQRGDGYAFHSKNRHSPQSAHY